MKILEFTTEAEAQACIDAINTMAANYWQAQGYTVIDNNGVKELISKNAATGEDELDKTRTITWHTPQLSPDNTYWIYSLTDQNPDWADWKNTLAAAPYNFTAIGVEKEFPTEWIPDEPI